MQQQHGTAGRKGIYKSGSWYPQFYLSAWLESLTNGSNNQLQTFSSIILIKRKRVTCVNGTWDWTNWFQNSKDYFLCTNSMNSVVTPICLTISIPKTEKRMLHEECKVKYHKVDSSGNVSHKYSNIEQKKGVKWKIRGCKVGSSKKCFLRV